MKNLGEEIRNKRLEKGMSIEELSEKTMLSIAVLKDIENGAFDRYEGEEMYVKQYLKKLSNALDLDGAALTKTYIELTQQIKQADLDLANQKAEVAEEEREEKKKSFKLEKPDFASKKSVYEEKNHIKVIRGVIAFLVVALIVALVWIAVSSTHKTTETKNYSETTENVTGDVDTKKEDTKKESTAANSSSASSSSSSSSATSENGDVTFTKKSNFRYEFSVGDAEEFTFKAVFKRRAWAKMTVNGSNTKDFQSKIYNNSNSEAGEEATVTFKTADFKELKLNNGNSQDAEYYINDVKVPYTDEETHASGSTVLRLTLVQSETNTDDNNG